MVSTCLQNSCVSVTEGGSPSSRVPGPPKAGSLGVIRYWLQERARGLAASVPGYVPPEGALGLRVHGGSVRASASRQALRRRRLSECCGTGEERSQPQSHPRVQGSWLYDDLAPRCQGGRQNTDGKKRKLTRVRLCGPVAKGTVLVSYFSDG